MYPVACACTVEHVHMQTDFLSFSFMHTYTHTNTHIHTQVVLRRKCFPFISMETTTDKENTIILLDRASFQLHFPIELPLVVMHF